MAPFFSKIYLFNTAGQALPVSHRSGERLRQILLPI